MKYLLITIFLLSAFISYSQIEVRNDIPKVSVGKVTNFGKLVAEMYYTVLDSDTTYTILFDNMKYQHISSFESVSFSPEDGTVEQLYSIMKSVFAEENKKNKEYKMTFKLGATEIIVSNHRTMGASQMMFFVSKGYFLLSEKQVDKLFSK